MWGDIALHKPGCEIGNSRLSKICAIIPINPFHKPHNASVPHPTIHHSEQKCVHFCSEWQNVGKMHCGICKNGLLLIKSLYFKSIDVVIFPRCVMINVETSRSLYKCITVIISAWTDFQIDRGNHISECYIDGLVQERRSSIADALKLRLSCTNPLIYYCISRAKLLVIPVGAACAL